MTNPAPATAPQARRALVPLSALPTTLPLVALAHDHVGRCAVLWSSSGAQIRHRLSRAGNRRMNHVLYIAVFVQLRHDTAGRAYYRRNLAAGKTPMEAMRCLKRRLSDTVY
jgi:transposase